MKFLILLIMVQVSMALYGQGKTPVLERTLTINFEQERLDVALKKISQAAEFTFSYNSSIVETDKRISYRFTQKTVREILDILFHGEIQYRARGKYIILTKAPKSSSTNEAKVLSGYVIDEATGKRLQNVSVYDPVTLTSAVTDSYGYFNLEIKNPTGEDIKLAVNKRDYTDTLLVVPSSDGRLLNIPIKLNKEKFNVLVDSLGSKLKRAWTATKNATQQSINMENISDTLYRKTQVSLIPFVGTNGNLSGNVINDYSFNIFGGYSLGVQKFELAGHFNIVRGNMNGVQLAGLANWVLGKNKGLQLSGLVNAVMDSSSGGQLAGLINFNLTSAQKFAMAGLTNVTAGDSHGVMISGLANYTLGEQRGPHVAGLFNFSTHDTGPVQLAGLFNFTLGSMHGVQAAGLFNFADDQMRGTQIAGLFNLSPKYLKGIQIAPFNFAKRVEGTQLGVVNVSKSIKGVPIGVLSLVGKGYHKIEVSADEIFYTNIAFRTGVRQFYNIITAGANPSTFEGDTTTWTFGYGVGTAPKITEWLSLNFDLTSNQVVKGNSIEAINLVNKFYVGCDFHLTKHFSITTGITLNGHVTKTTANDYPELFTHYEPNIIDDRDFGKNLNLKMWWGAKIGLRFL